ncbi:MAG TPA: hypothetical protein DCY79_23150 [Planctomycetaceae bacterium]|nr:hypothetical protein [Planctomycetaceae bacterium]
MRLTLRTMLAYLDDVLSPQDATALGDKIKQSEYATKLSRHIRSSIRESKVGAPALSGKGTIDANAVAEYLDSALPSDQIEGYETLCLPPSEELERTANEHMAETAACHQILTLVLGQSAECSNQLKHRIYRLDPHATGRAGHPGASEADSTSAPAANGNPQAATQTAVERTEAAEDQRVAPAESRSSQEVPEYLLRNPQKIRLLPLAAMLLLGFLLTFAALRALGPFGPQHPLLGTLLSGDASSEQIASDTVSPQDPSPSSDTANEPEPSKTVGADPASEPTGTNPGGVEDQAPEQPAGTTGENPDTSSADGAPQVLDGTVPAPVSDTSIPQPAEPADSDKPIVVPSLPKENPVEPAATSEGTLEPTDPKEPSEVPATDEPAPTDPVPPPATVAVDVGRFISGDQILVREQPETDAWHRVKQLTTLKSGDRLQVLPGFRPQIVLASGVQMTFVGASQLALTSTGDDAIPGLQMAYGRLLASTNGMAGPKLQLKTANAQGTLMFSEADTVIALETRRFLSPGSDPLADAGDDVTQIIVTGGKLLWLSDGAEAKPVEVKAGQVLVVVGEGPAKMLALAAPPAWTAVENDLDSTDRYAAPELESFVGPDRPLSLTLMEQLDHRQRDVRSLVARCLSYLDIHEPIVAQLNDNDQRRYWFASIDVLRDAIMRSPASATKLQEAFEKKRGDVAPELFRLCWGYSQEQLEQGAAAELVAFLESDAMDVRVLTLATLKAITGRTELYSPEREPKQEKSEIQNWKKNLEKGAIQYVVPPAALPYQDPAEGP